MNDYTKENLEKVKKIFNQNKDYNKEKYLIARIKMFELYKLAKNWINEYKSKQI